MDSRGHADEEVRFEIPEFNGRLFRKGMSSRQGNENGIVRHAFGEQVAPGMGRTETDEAEIDSAGLECLELFRAGHIKKIQGHARAKFAECSKSRGEKPVMNIGDVS